MNETILKRIHSFKCQHNKYLVNEKLAYIECGICGEHLDPMWVIGQLCNRERRANVQLDNLNKLAEKAEKKNRCKCEHCGKMTKIQKR